jgi:RND superfamily putative drug exporter
LQSQGFVDAWAPIFFFALVFALGHRLHGVPARDGPRGRRPGRGRRARPVDGLARSGRVINAAAVVMAAVFMTFALAGPIPPKEMGVILAVAILLDATLIRLVLLPVVLRLLGERAWWMPRWMVVRGPG